jgi:hypothetical protein
LVTEALAKAEDHRRRRLSQYIGGVRLAGLEQLYEYLDASRAAYENAPGPEPAASDQTFDIRQIAFLLERVKTDFQTALEAAMSGYATVASDAMRDVMEIEALLLDFVTSPEHLAEWLAADRATLIGKFGPATVRRRLKDAGVKPWSDPGFVAVDYQAHSQSLHVSPHVFPIGGERGVAPSSGTMFDDLPFMEMFEHGIRVTKPIEVLRLIAYDIGPRDADQLVPSDKFETAYERTRQMQFMVITFLTAPRESEAALGRPATEQEVREYIAKRFRDYAEELEASDSE